MVLTGIMTRPSGSHRDQLVFASIELTNRLASGWSGGVAYGPPQDAVSCASAANEVWERFGLHQARFRPDESTRITLLANRVHELLLDLAADDLDAAVPRINALLAEYPARLHLSSQPPYALHYQDHAAIAVEGWQVGCGAALASWVSSKATQYIRRCDAQRCDRVFFDHTRSGTRRFCSTGCRNRDNVRVYRLRHALERQSAQPAGAPS